MNRRERLMASLQGKPVDRPPACFYEINGFTQNPDDRDPFNICNDPSWRPLLKLARDRSDVIINAGTGLRCLSPDPLENRVKTEQWTDAEGARFTRTTIDAGTRKLTSVSRRDPAVDTHWMVEHLLKDADDLRAWLELPEREPEYAIDVAHTTDMEARIGDAGIVMPNMADPVCSVAALFDMGTWTILAMTEQDLMKEALERRQRQIRAMIRLAARELPGRLWRICGPEYASEPYLPPRLFHEYVTGHVTEIVEAIQSHGGYARVHSHGRLKNILDEIASTGCKGLDPIEPPGQGDMELADVRERVGSQMTLFGNIEIADIENMSTPHFERKIATALEQGPGGRGFVLMPSACPYGRTVTPLCLRNYERMIEMAEALA